MCHLMKQNWPTKASFYVYVSSFEIQNSQNNADRKGRDRKRTDNNTIVAFPQGQQQG